MISETLDLMCDMLNMHVDHGYKIDRAHDMCRLRASHRAVTGWMNSETELHEWLVPYYQGLKDAGVPASNARRAATEAEYLLALAQDRADLEAL